MIEVTTNQKIATDAYSIWYSFGSFVCGDFAKAIKTSWKPDIENIRQVIAEYLWLLYLSQYTHNKALKSSHKSMTSFSSNRLERIQQLN